MAEKFSGTFSPGGNASLPTSTPAPQFKSGRAKLLFFAPLPLLITGFGALRGGDYLDMIGYYGGFGVLILAAWLLRDGLKAHAAFDARKSARRPAFPRKIFASVLTGSGMIAVSALALKHSLPFSVALGVLSAALHSFSFGLDPMKNKGMEGFDEFANERVATAIAKAEKQLDTMKSVIARSGDRALIARVAHFAETARTMFRIVQDDPGDLGAARKYLGVYLRGAAEATVKFTDLYARAADPAIRADYETLLDDLESHFTARQADLLLDDQSDLDVEIEVLRERLKADGLK